MRKRISILFLITIVGLCLGFLPSAVIIQSASEPLGLTNVTLWLYPEYDDPRLLVMLEGQISGINIPTRIRFLVPATAEMYSAGSKDAQGKYSGGPPERIRSQIPGWDEISYTLQNSTFRMEYYDPIINGKTEKTISYEFLTLYPINSLDTIVQVPKTATNFLVSPPGTKTVEGNFTVFTSKYTNLAVDQNLHFEISYSKSDPNPSLNNAEDISQGKSTWIIWLLLVVIGIFMVVGILIVALKSNKKNSKLTQKTLNKRKNTTTKTRQLRSKYCSQCGKPLEFPSKFCPHCRYKIDN